MAEKIKITDSMVQGWLKDHQDAIVEVTGELGFCKFMTTKLAGEELAKDIENQKTKLKRKQPNRDERYTFQLNNAKVVVSDRNNPNPMEVIINQRRYEAKDITGKCITVEKNGKRGFMFGYKQPNGRIKQVKLEDQSVLSGQKVTIQYGVFAYNDGQDFSIGADAVVFDEYPQLYVPGNAFKEAYEKRGWDLDDDETGDNNDPSDTASEFETVADGNPFDDADEAEADTDASGSAWD